MGRVLQDISSPWSSLLGVQSQAALRCCGGLRLPSREKWPDECAPVIAMQIIKVAGTISAIRDAIELLMQHWGQNPSGRELSTSLGDRLRLRMLVPKVTGEWFWRFRPAWLALLYTSILPRAALGSCWCSSACQLCMPASSMHSTSAPGHRWLKLLGCRPSCCQGTLWL